MNYYNQNIRNEDRKEDKPPHSRIFVVCSKHTKEEDLRSPFEQFGIIDDIYIPRDRNSGEAKGVAYIKYNKTSSAALAIQEMHLKTLQNDTKPLKVMVAVNRNDTHSSSEDRYTRLFIMVPKRATENEIKEHFSTFGKVESVHLQRDKLTDTNKGFAYVQYNSFLEAAKAYEECDKRYRPKFAVPKEELKRSRNSLETDNFHSTNPSICYRDSDCYHARDDINSMVLAKPQGYNRVNIRCNPQVPQRYIEQLFNIVPGMKQCQYSLDMYNGACKATIVYEDEKAAAYAVERLNNYEFPSGEILSVKPDKNPLNRAAADLNDIVNNFKNAIDSGNPDLMQLADAIAQASTLIKVATCKSDMNTEQEQDLNYCNVPLPPIKPLANINSRVVQRCFIVCKPHPPPSHALKDIFSRFGDLVHVSIFPNKIFGFAKYASVKSAQNAIKTLNGSIVCGVSLKVMEADERPTRCDDGNKLRDENIDNTENGVDNSRKRMRLIDDTD